MSTSVTNLTLNRLIEEFSIMSGTDKFVESFFYGDFNAIISSNKIKHTALLMNTADGVLDENYITFRLELACMDKVFNDQSNLKDVESDTIQILQDIFSVITYSNRWQSFSKVSSSTPVRKFISKGEDMATGWSMTLNLSVKRKHGICSVPLIGYDFEGDYRAYCAGVRIFENEILVRVEPSGGRYDYSTSGASIDIYVNEILFFAGATSNKTINVFDSALDEVGSKVGDDYIIADSLVNIVDSASALLHAKTVKAEATGVQTIDDSIVEITDSALNVLYSKTVKAENTTSQIISDSTKTHNGVLLVPTPAQQDVEYSTYNSNGDFIGVVATNTANIIDIVVGDSEIEINDSVGANLYTIQIKAEGATVQVISNSTAVIKDSAGATLYTVSVKAQNTADQVVPDSTVLVKNSAGTTLYTTTVKAANTANQTVADTTANAKNSLGTTLVTGAVISGVTKDLAVPDITKTDSDGAVTAVAAGVNVTCTLHKNIATTWKDGQTTSFVSGDAGEYEIGAGSAFLTLEQNNLFGNTNRFTDELGGQTYTKNYVCDWATYNQITGRVRVWYRTPTSSVISTALANSPYTLSSIAGWYVPNFKQLVDIFNNETQSGVLNYAPFNIVTNSIANSIIISNTSSAVNGWRQGNVFGLISTTLASTCRYIVYRDCTLAELATL